jgi:hypothetical protein
VRSVQPRTTLLCGTCLAARMMTHLPWSVFQSLGAMLSWHYCFKTGLMSCSCGGGSTAGAPQYFVGVEIVEILHGCWCGCPPSAWTQGCAFLLQPTALRAPCFCGVCSRRWRPKRIAPESSAAPRGRLASIFLAVVNLAALRTPSLGQTMESVL